MNSGPDPHTLTLTPLTPRVPTAASGEYEIWGSAIPSEHVWMEVPRTEPHASTYFTGGVGEILVRVPPRKER
ncbi:MAG: hypothetical protein LC732_06285 [Acidobacteria bacterium]|nr:hypothetical protein [Acidobacteriota bacterium]